jgi:hypothetical protein
MAHDQGHCLRGKSATLAGRVADPLRLHPCKRELAISLMAVQHRKIQIISFEVGAEKALTRMQGSNRPRERARFAQSGRVRLYIATRAIYAMQALTHTASLRLFGSTEAVAQSFRQLFTTRSALQG